MARLAKITRLLDTVGIGAGFCRAPQQFKGAEESLHAAADIVKIGRSATLDDGRARGCFEYVR